MKNKDMASVSHPYHVCYGKDGWVVRKHKSIKAVKVFGDQREWAIVFGEEIAKAHRADLYIHAANGGVERVERWRPDETDDVGNANVR